WLQEAAFPDQPMGRTILGPAERVREFSREDLSRFVTEHYRPERMILAAAGAVDHDEIMKLAEGIFGALARGGAEQVEPAGFIGGERRELKHLEQVHFTLGLEGPSYSDEAIYTAQTWAGALGGGMSSRLFQEVREKRGLCYSIYAQAGAYSDTGMITIYAGTSGEQIADLAEITVDELKRAAEDMTVEEIDRARAQMKAGLLMGLEGASARAERLARQVAIWGRVVPLEETVAKIDAVDLVRVRDFATGLVSGAGTALALYGPAEAAPGLAAIRERLAA
ncbi:MAG: insulinase family protein, partial [Maritimibacter sp.]|nr:insulinase family protein [Maritimibacter sp.]